MRRTPRFVVVAFPVVVLAAAFWLRPAPPRSISVPHPTVEPTLPLVLDLHPSRRPDGVPGPARSLEAVIEASSDVRDVVFSLILPPEVSGDVGELRPGRSVALKAGEKKTYSVPLQSRREGSFPIRLEASFRLSDGRLFRTQQGMMWKSGDAPEGRHHAGAYEWMGVPVAEPQP